MQKRSQEHNSIPTRGRKSNTSRRRKKYVSKEHQEKLKAKGLEVEEALRLQREKQREMTQQQHTQDQEHISTSNPPVFNARPQLHGLAYDDKTQRYYKISSAVSPSVGSILQRLTATPPAPVFTSTVTPFTSLLHRRLLLPSASSSTQLSYSHLRLHRQSSLFSPFSGHFTMGHFHPSFGLAVANANLTRIEAFSGNIMNTLVKTLGVRWCEVSDVPLLAIITAPRHQPQALCTLSVLNAASATTASSLLSHDLCRYDAVCWTSDLSNVVVGSSQGLLLLDSSALSQLSIIRDDAITAITNHSNSIIAGLRKGLVKCYDIRTSSMRNGRVVAKMPFCVENIHVFKNGVSVMAQDVTGCVRVYDIRYCRREVLRIADGDESKVYRGGWYVSCDERIVLTTAAEEVCGSSNIVVHHIDSGTSRYLSSPADAPLNMRYRILPSCHQLTSQPLRGIDVWGNAVFSVYYGAYAYSVSDPTILFAIAP